MRHLQPLKCLVSIAFTLALGASLTGCKTLPAGQGYSWVDCATEGQVCRVAGPAEVRYGARGQYEYRSTNGPIWCGNDSFRDPAPGMVKHCQVRSHASPGYPVNRPAQWEYCAREDGVCHPPFGATVRFGANDRHAFVRNVNGPISCSVRAFGDPIRGIAKSCEYSMPRH